jgi:hypothetical protein
MRLVMCMKVRDEDDILELNLRHHHAQGVDLFIVTDNGSSDRTPEILRRWRDAGLLHLIEEPAADFRHEAHRWVTRMARLAATEHGADWVFHGDADEFWWPLGSSLKGVLEEIPAPYGAVVAPRPEFVARPDGPGPFYERMTVRETFSRLRPKIAHRAEPDAVLHRGAHDVDIESAGEVRRGGRAVLRAVKGAPPPADGRLVWAPRFPARVLHFPIRSFEQYQRRVEAMLFHGGWDDKAQSKLRSHYEGGGLAELYEDLVHDDARVAAGRDDGSLKEDRSLRDFLAACPDPLAGRAARPALPTPPPGVLEAELAANELDAMRTISRTERSLVRQLDSLRARLDEQRRKLRDAEAEQDQGAGILRALRSVGRKK